MTESINQPPAQSSSPDGSLSDPTSDIRHFNAQVVRLAEQNPNSLINDAPEDSGRFARIGRGIGMTAVHGLIVGGALLGAAGAIQYAPPTHIEFAGQDATVKPVIGQNSSSLNILRRTTYVEIPLIDKAVGVNVHVDVNGITFQDKATRAALAQFKNDPAPSMDRIRSTAMESVYILGGSGFVYSLAAGELFLYARKRRKNVLEAAGETMSRAATDRLENLARVRTALTAYGMVATISGGLAMLHNDDRPVHPSNVFAGTPLQGTEITGAAGEIAPYILHFIDPGNPAVVQQTDRNITKLVANRPDLNTGSSHIRILVGEDFQSNDAAAQYLGVAAKALDVNAIVVTGDMVQYGKPIENEIFDVPKYYSDNKPIYFAPGLHDTNESVKGAKMAGWKVILNKVVMIGKYKMMFAASPLVSDVGNGGPGDSLRDPKAGANMRRTAAVQKAINETKVAACNGKPAIFFNHQNDIGAQIAATGCADLVVSGRSYKVIGRKIIKTGAGGNAIQYIGGSGAGNEATSINVGTLPHTGHETLLDIDTATNVISSADISENPNGTVHISQLAYLATADNS